MDIVRDTAALRLRVAEWRKAGERIVLVPTMGNLHQGHLSLVHQAFDAGDRVVVSLFVNPLQFNNQKDFETYPLTFDEDVSQMTEAGIDLLFAPSREAIYPGGDVVGTRIQVSALSETLEGVHRPGHFDGMALIVCKLFNLVGPDVAVFGQKDYQQLLIVKQMVRDLNMPVSVLAAETVRETDGLAMSSRNQHLTAQERVKAPLIYQILCQLRSALRSGERDYAHLEQMGRVSLNEQGFLAEYVSIRQTADLSLPEAGQQEWVILVAAKLENTRLIDNLTVSLVG